MFQGRQVSLLVFDLDGTLIDSRADLATAVNATLQQFDRQPLHESVIGGFIGDGASALVERALLATGGLSATLLEEAMPAFLRFYRHHMLDKTYVYDGVIDALRHIQHQAPQLPMAVLTNKPVGPSQAICKALALAPFFFANYGGNSFNTKKPNPEGLLALVHEASRLNGCPILPAETLLVGDSDVDVLTARAAGAHSLGCTYGLATDAMLAARPDAVVHHARDWPAALHLQS